MSNILLLYGSTYGQTERVARRLADLLIVAGHRVTMRQGDHLPHDFELASYDGYIIAASVLFGKHQRYMRRLVRLYADLLNARPSAFVSLCGAAAGTTPSEQAQAQGYVDQFLRETGWRPTVTRGFAGAVAYRQYNPILRYVMKRISRKVGRPTDTSRNYDFTDWAAVDGFAGTLASLFESAAPAADRNRPPVLSAS